MRYADIETLLAEDKQAQDFFAGLSEDMQSALLAHGRGINTLEELKRFTEIIGKRG